MRSLREPGPKRYSPVRLGVHFESELVRKKSGLVRRIMRMRRLHVFLALVPLFASCSGGSDPKELTNDAMVAIGSGDWNAGLAGFEKALEHMDPTSPEYMRASIGRCRALARLDPARGKSEFLKLADAQKSRIEFQDFHLMVGEFMGRGDYPTAVDMMESAKAMFPGSPKFKEMADSVVKASKNAGDSRALAKLKSLGYL